MSTMTISLPDPLLQFVESQVAQGRYGDASEYMRALIHADEKRAAQERLESLLREGLEGEETAFTPQDWHAMRLEALAQVRKSQTHAA